MNVPMTTAWILAARPKTLPAAIIPVLVGSSVAAHDGAFSWLPAIVALLCAVLIQIATNLGNDYFDFIGGVDTEKRLGPARAVQSGMIEPAHVRNAMIAALIVTFGLGLYLVSIGGWPILLIGIASILCAVAYSTGPLPLSYVGLGDVFVFLFFGIVAVTGTYYVQALQWSTTALIASLPVGALSTAILVVNNYRDIDTDREAGRKTLAVRMGRERTRVQYAILLLFTYLVPIVQTLLTDAPILILLPLLSMPIAWRLLGVIKHSTDGPSLNNALAGTGKLLALYGALYSVGYLTQTWG